MVLLSAALRLLTIWVTAVVSNLIGVDISTRIFDTTLHQPYLVHTERNSAEVAATVFDKSNYISKGIILTSLRTLASLAVLVSIFMILAWLNPTATALGLAFVAFTYALIVFATRSVLTETGRIVNQKSNVVYQTVNEGLGGIREVILGNTQKSSQPDSMQTNA